MVKLSTGKIRENRDKSNLSTKLSTLSTVLSVDRDCGRIRKDKTCVLYNSEFSSNQPAKYFLRKYFDMEKLKIFSKKF